VYTLSLHDALPILKGSDKEVNLYFDRYFTKPINVSSNDLDTVVAFFENRGFDNSAAMSVAVVLLQQAKLDNINVFSLLETLKGLKELQLSVVVAEVLNYNRKRTSTLGFKRVVLSDKIERRNIIV
jgi:hypothetical protein